jgi:hypothetical protein
VYTLAYAESLPNKRPPVTTGGITARARQSRGVIVNIITSAGPLISLIAGILILAMPRLLNYIVAIYLIVIGLLGLFGGHLR